MTNEIFDQQLTLSLQRLEDLWRRANELPQPSGNIKHQTNELSVQDQALIRESLEELSKGIEELQVAVEEIHQQSEELAVSKTLVTAEHQRYQELFEFAPDGYVVTTKEGTICEVNRIAAQLFNVSQQRVVDKPLVLFISAEERQEFYSKLSQLQKGETIRNWLVSIQRRRGACIRVALTAIPVEEQGQVVSLRWRILELVSAVEGEQGSKGAGEQGSRGTGEKINLSSESLFRAMFENAAVGLALLDSQGCVLKTNQALQKMLGFYQFEELQTIVPELMNLDKLGEESTLFQQLIAGQCRSYQLEKCLINQATSIRWGRLTVSLVQGAEDEPAFATCMLEDITEVRQFEEAQLQALESLDVSDQELNPSFNNLLDTNPQPLATSVEQLAQVLNEILSSSEDFFCVCDRTDQLIYVNQAMAQAVGLGQSDFVGKTWQQLEFPQEIRQQLELQKQIVFSTGQPLTDEISFPSVDGIRNYEYTISLISNINNATDAVVITVKDITDHKQAIAAANEALAKEVELSTLHSHFASIVPHELRNPLNSIACCAQLVEKHSRQWTQEKQLTYLRRIQVDVKRINQLLDDLSLIRNAQARTLELAPALLDITEFCRELVKELQQDAGANHKIIFISQTKRSGIWDEKLLRRILLNLLLDAIKYSPEGSEIKLSVVCEKGKAIFRIQDSGIGIPEQDQALLFKTFQRGSNVDSITGTGLGLSIVKQCVDLHKGEISVESEISVGTTFTVKLPLNHPKFRV